MAANRVMSTLASIGTAAIALFLFVICLPRCIMRRVGQWSRLDEDTNASTNANTTSSTTVMCKSQQPFTQPAYKIEDNLEVVVMGEDTSTIASGEVLVEPRLEQAVGSRTIAPKPMTRPPGQWRRDAQLNPEQGTASGTGRAPLAPDTPVPQAEPFSVPSVEEDQSAQQEGDMESIIPPAGEGLPTSGQPDRQLPHLRSDQVNIESALNIEPTPGPQSPFLASSLDGGLIQTANSPILTSPLQRTKSAPSNPMEQENPSLNEVETGCESSGTKEVKVLSGVAEDIGQKRRMEDTHVVVHGLPRCDGQSAIDTLIGIFDGHNGDKAALFAAEKIAGFIAEGEGDMGDVITGAFDRCERELWSMYDEGGAVDWSGSTGLLTTVSGNWFHVGNLGDCRAVLCRDGRAEQITNDHKPGNERDRVVEAGGYLDGEQYLNGEIGVSRAFGDFHLELDGTKKRDGSGPLIAVPEIHSQEVCKDCEFMVLGSDGVWDVISNQRASDIVRKLLVDGSSPQKAAVELVDEAKLQGSRDNITAAVLALKELPLPPRKPPPKLKNSRLRLASKSMLDVKGALEQVEAEPIIHPIDVDL